MREDHEQNVLQLLDEMGRTLARREKLFEEIEGRHAQVRNSWVQGTAEQTPDQDTLASELQWELDRQREQELELHEILDVLQLQRELEDRFMQELEPHLVQEHRDRIYDELKGMFERRDELFDGAGLMEFGEKRDRIKEIIPYLNALEEALSRLVERHLVHRHKT